MGGAVLAANSAVPVGAYRNKGAWDADLASAKEHAAGVVCIAPDGDILLLRRSPNEANFAGHWALPGGGGEAGETPEQTARREAREEIGQDISDDSFKALDKRVTPTGMAFHTFAAPVDKFWPSLNSEHVGAGWFPLSELPQPLHPAVEATLRDRVGAADQGDFAKWAREPEADIGATDSALTLALDRDTVREKDRDGRLRVSSANISKANVCPYRGREIPNWQALGLDGDRVYNLLRSPEELEKAAKSSNGVPLLRKHVAVNAMDHKPYDVVGSLGTDAKFDGTYLTNSLFVNAGDAIDGIESDRQKELSMGYHYTADMTPGKFGGIAYDGVMRDIVVNHVALVKDGRAGPDVVVGDSLENLNMKPTRFAALTLAMTSAAIAPLMAMDAKLDIPLEPFAKLSRKNFKESRPAILDAVRKATDGKLRAGLAFDESPVAKVLCALEEMTGEAADESVSEEQHKAMEAAAAGNSDLGIPEKVGKEFVDKDKGKAFDADAIRNFLTEKGMGEDDVNSLMGMLPSAQAADEDDQEKKDNESEAMRIKERERKEKDDKTAKDNAMKDMVTKPAMDEALKLHGDEVAKRVRESERGIRTALSKVKPWIGELPASMAFDSAEDVYRHTLKALGYENHAKVHADALLPILESQRKPGDRPAAAPTIAMDSAAVDTARKVAPGLERIRIGA